MSDMPGHSNQWSRIHSCTADSDWSLTKSKYFITVALVDRLAADDVAVVVHWRWCDQMRDVLATVVGWL